MPVYKDCVLLHTRTLRSEGQGELRLMSESELQQRRNGDGSTHWLWQIPASGFPVYPFGIRLTGSSKAESDLIPTKQAT